jgi:hypothetical protein
VRNCFRMSSPSCSEGTHSLSTLFLDIQGKTPLSTPGWTDFAPLPDFEDAGGFIVVFP